MKASANSVYGTRWFFIGRVIVGDVYFGSFGVSPASMSEQRRHLRHSKRLHRLG